MRQSLHHCAQCFSDKILSPVLRYSFLTAEFFFLEKDVEQEGRDKCNGSTGHPQTSIHCAITAGFMRMVAVLADAHGRRAPFAFRR